MFWEGVEKLAPGWTSDIGPADPRPPQLDLSDRIKRVLGAGERLKELLAAYNPYEGSVSELEGARGGAVVAAGKKWLGWAAEERKKWKRRRRTLLGSSTDDET